MQEQSTVARDVRGCSVIQAGMITFACARNGCTNKFIDHHSQGRTYCSNECKHAAKKRTSTRTCANCNQPYELVPSRKSTYCSAECYREIQSKRANDRQSERLDNDQFRSQVRKTKYETDNTNDPFGLPADVDIRSYLVGIFDGEGCITGGYDKRDGRYFLVIGVCMASETITKLFVKQWGGNCTPRSTISVGGLTMWDWRLVASRSREFLEYVAQRSITKRRQAVLALQLAENMAKYAKARFSGEFRPNLDGRFLTQDDHALRQDLVSRIRAMNGARSRFSLEHQSRLKLPD